MKLFGVTGGIGMGKSLVGRLLDAAGTRVIDSDVIAHELVAPGQESLRDIQEDFGPEMIDSDGKLRRDLLAQKVFSDSAARARLENILHPRIRAAWKARVASVRASGQPIVAVIIPLLFETDCQSEFEKVVCIACAPATQHQRLLARGWSTAEIEGRLAAQWPIEKKIAGADYVVWNEAGEEELLWQLNHVGLVAPGVTAVPRTGDSPDTPIQVS
jgi:dephospho-CoA kinase